MQSTIAVLVVVFCMVVPLWFVVTKAPYHGLASRLRSPAVVVSTVIGILVLIGIARLRILGFALVVPATQLLILIAVARLYEAVAGEPLQHFQLQAFDFVGRFRHALASWVATLLAATVPLYVLFRIFLDD